MSQTPSHPTTTSGPASGGPDTPEVRSVASGQGWTWITEGFEIFKKQPGLWVGIALLLFVILLVLAFIPILGSIATMLLMPIFAGGLMMGCRSLQQGGQLEIAHLFAGFSNRAAELVIVGALGFAGAVVIMVPVLLITGGGAFLGASRGDAAGAAMVGGSFLLAALIGLALSIPLYMALWFAPALVALRGVAPVAAIKMSFSGCLRNFVPFLVYGVVLLVLGIVAAIPFGLGWLVLGPVTIASVYTSYRDIYGDG
jgi:uncharacterized membrane protein